MDWLKPGVRVPPAGPNTPLSTLICGLQVPGRHRFWTPGARGGLRTKADPDGDVVLVLVGSVRGGRTHRCHRQGAFLTTLYPQSCDRYDRGNGGGPFPSKASKVSVHSSLLPTPLHLQGQPCVAGSFLPEPGAGRPG